MTQRLARIGYVVLSMVFVAPAMVAAQEQLSARLVGVEEVPSVVTPSAGSLQATVSPAGDAIQYTLSYSGLEGTVQQGHIHIGQKGVNGSIAIWLCQTATPFLDPAGLAPICPQGSGTVTGTLTMANIVPAGLPIQGIATLADVLAALRSGVAYANVHTSVSPGGRIRGQIRHVP